MKTRSFLLALALLISAAASAQHNRNSPAQDRDRNTGTYSNDNDYNAPEDCDYSADDYTSRDNNRNYNDRRRTEYRSRNGRYAQRRLPAMSNRDFRQAVYSIRHENFDSDKARLAKMIVSRYMLNTEQIRTMAQLLHFDSSRLDFAKYAYASCADPENYYIVSRAFTFSSSRKELMDYLARV